MVNEIFQTAREGIEREIKRVEERGRRKSQEKLDKMGQQFYQTCSYLERNLLARVNYQTKRNKENLLALISSLWGESSIDLSQFEDIHGIEAVAHFVKYYHERTIELMAEGIIYFLRREKDPNSRNKVIERVEELEQSLREELYSLEISDPRSPPNSFENIFKRLKERHKLHSK